ncbi:MAG TPA: hypothetical protein VN920_04405 [Pyrinomonadaceae bacterium]|nr:hypothetical protein [Pyrinomonadaceae bacterium]
MTIRERGNIWPVISVAAGAFFVLAVMPLILHRQQSGQMATVDAHVTIGDSGGESLTNASTATYRWPDSEVPRTAERLRDLTAVAIAASSSIVDGAMHRQPLRDANDILNRIAQRQLIPATWLTQQSGILQTPHSTIHIRYAPQSVTLEVVSVPNERKDGPAMLIRIPDPENTGVGPRYFESMQLDGIVYPSPFAPIAEIVASGWQPRLFKQSQIPDEQRAQLEQWVKNTIAK